MDNKDIIAKRHALGMVEGTIAEALGASKSGTNDFFVQAFVKTCHTEGSQLIALKTPHKLIICNDVRLKLAVFMVGRLRVRGS